MPQFAFCDTGTFHNYDYVETRRPDDQAIYSLTWTQDLPWATLTAAGSLYKRDFGFFRDNTSRNFAERGAAGRDYLLQRAVRAAGSVPGAHGPVAGHRAAHGGGAPELDRRRPALLARRRVLSRA